MNFNEKLYKLRKEKNLTQEELAEALFVSRTAVSKWESGRGYPNIDSLKAIAKFFGVTVDELLSSDELLTIAEKDTEQKEKHSRNLVFGLIDISTAIFFFLPLFGQREGSVTQAVSLLSLNAVASYLRTAYFAALIVIISFGILTVALQKSCKFFRFSFNTVSLILNSAAVALFIISTQPYAAILMFVFLMIKVLMLIKHR